MATITARRRKDGVRYTAQIRIQRAGKAAYSESKTFPKRALAVEWAKRREAELATNPGAVSAVAHRKTTLGELMQRYLDDRAVVAPLGRSKDAHIRMMLQFRLADLPALSLQASDIIAHVRERRLAGTSGATVQNDVVWLRVVLRYARSALGVPVDMQVVEDAADVCWGERLLAKPERRNRRPSAVELQQLADYYARPRNRRSKTRDAMYLLLWASIYSARRLSELCALRLADYDQVHGMWMVRDLKHPGGSEGHDAEMVVSEPFAQVVEVMRETVSDGERLAPFVSGTVGTYWQQTTRLLGIEDLHYHDLRHEACSRLAEDGMSIPHIQQISLHESWSSLQRYVNIRRRPEPRVEFDPQHPSIKRLLRDRESTPNAAGPRCAARRGKRPGQ